MKVCGSALRLLVGVVFALGVVAIAGAGCGGGDGGNELEETCSDAVDNFVACGGDLTGTWKFKAVCPDEAMKTEPVDSCPDMQGDINIDVDGTVTWDGTNMVFHDLSYYRWMIGSAPASCLPSDETCEQQSEFSEFDVACATEGAICVCSGGIDSFQQDPISVPYRIEGTDLVILGSFGLMSVESVESIIPYCIGENDAVLKHVARVFGASKPFTYRWVLETPAPQ